MNVNEERVLVVDDEPRLLAAVQRNLCERFAVEVANGGAEGLAAIETTGPFAVVVSDMRMPQMTGAEFLGRVRVLSPDAVRIMLTGDAEQQTAVAAVNDGNVFRFLNKPCRPDTLCKAIDDGLVEHRIRKREKELLSNTLAGSIGLLVDVLSLVNPKAFGRSSNIRTVARDVALQLGMTDTWELEVAAMLCLVGCVTVPVATLERLVRQLPMSQDEKRLIAEYPKVGGRLLSRIPRLERVATIIENHARRMDGSDFYPPSPPADLPVESRILKAAVDFDAVVEGGKAAEDAITVLYARDGWYDAHVLEALRASLDIPYALRTVMIDELRDGMVLDEHVFSNAGSILVSLGREVNAIMRERLNVYATTGSGVRQPIRVRCPLAGAAASNAARQSS